MAEKDEQKLSEILGQILRSSPGVRYVMLMDRTGLMISYEMKFRTDSFTYIERLGAIGAAVFQAVDEQGSMIEYGETQSQITEYISGFIFSISTGQGILCVVTDKNINIGFIRNIMIKNKENISKILDRYLKQDTNEISNELKGMIKDNMVNF